MTGWCHNCDAEDVELALDGGDEHGPLCRLCYRAGWGESKWSRERPPSKNQVIAIMVNLARALGLDKIEGVNVD